MARPPRRSRTSRSRASGCRCRSCAGSGGIKAAAARGERRARRARRRRWPSGSPPPGDAVAAGEHDDQFPIDVFQTGSGTSSNMNANEVIANLAGDGRPPQRPRQHGAVLERRLPLRRPPRRARRGHARPAAGDGGRWRRRSRRRRSKFADVVKAGRTHLMDAVPVTLGQEFGGYAAQVRLGVERVEATLRRVGQIPLGGTATGTGLNTHPEFAAKVRGEARRARPAWRSPSRSTASRRRATATRWSSSRARSRSTPSR